MFDAPSGKTYITGRTLHVPSGLSTTSCIRAAFLEGFSTAYPRSSRLPEHGQERAGQRRAMGKPGGHASKSFDWDGHSRRVALGSATRQAALVWPGGSQEMGTPEGTSLP